MQKLIELVKGKERLFIKINTPHGKAEFLKQATDEGFMIGNELPVNRECESVMIIHPDYTLNYCVGMPTNLLYHQSVGKRLDYEKYLSGEANTKIYF